MTPNADTGRVMFRCSWCGQEVWHGIKTTYFGGRFHLYHPDCWDLAAPPPNGSSGTSG